MVEMKEPFMLPVWKTRSSEVWKTSILGLGRLVRAHVWTRGYRLWVDTPGRGLTAAEEHHPCRVWGGWDCAQCEQRCSYGPPEAL